ncbi:MAG: glycoside hydrolase family 20 zincin-like fold domain-containing protein [Merdibacter sp.]
MEFLADYEQVIDRDGNIYKPLTGKTIKGVYKVTKADGTHAESDEFTLEVSGQYADEGENAKPIVIPELAEWHRTSSTFVATETSRIVIDANASDIATAAAEALQADYADESGMTMEIVKDGTPQAGDFYFVADAESMLDEEGYIMEIGDYVTVKAEQATGAYWWTRSILQILKMTARCRKELRVTILNLKYVALCLT